MTMGEIAPLFGLRHESSVSDIIYAWANQLNGSVSTTVCFRLLHVVNFCEPIHQEWCVPGDTRGS